MCKEQITFWTRNGLKLPQRTSPINFAVQRRHEYTSNAWGARIENMGDAYIYCRDDMKGWKASLHTYIGETTHLVGREGTWYKSPR